jgi:hypothetical protein
MRAKRLAFVGSPGGRQGPLKGFPLGVELLRHAGLELLEELRVVLHFLAPDGGVDLRQFPEALASETFEPGPLSPPFLSTADGHDPTRALGVGESLLCTGIVS